MSNARCSLLVLLAALVGPVVAQNQADWTILYYMAGDNDLEASQVEDLEEMLAVGSTDRVKVIALADRSEGDDPDGGYTDQGVGGLPDWTDALLLRLDRDQAVKLDSWGEANTGDPATLARFVKEGLARYPARRTALIIADHGMTWMGACSDESAEDDLLTLDEIAAGLAAGLGDRKLDLLGFDCCLMAGIEVADACAPHAAILVASEELEPGDGWSYEPTLRALTAQPAMDAEALGKVIADQYQAWFDEAEDESTKAAGVAVTLSVIRLDRIDAVKAALASLAALCGEDLAAVGRSSWVKLAQARSKAEEYGADGDPTAPGMAVHDLIHLTAELQTIHGAGPIAKAASRLAAAVRGAVAHTVRGEARPNANGLSIFLPPDAATLGDAADAAYQQVPFAAETGWFDLVKRYVTLAEDDTEELQLSELVIEEGEGEGDTEDLTITAEVAGDDFQEAQFVLASQEEDEGFLILGTVPVEPAEDGLLSMEWDGGWFRLEDAEGSVLCPVTDFQEIEGTAAAYLALVPCELQRRNGTRWTPVTLYFLIDFADENQEAAELVYCYRETASGAASEVTLKQGDKLRPQYLFIDADGEESLLTAEDAEDFLVVGKPSDLQMTYDDLPAGQYVVGYVVTDLSDNTTEQLAEVELK